MDFLTENKRKLDKYRVSWGIMYGSEFQRKFLERSFQNSWLGYYFFAHSSCIKM